MSLSRRQFLQRAVLTAAYSTAPAWLAACGRVADSAAPAAPTPATAPSPTVSAANADIAHLLNRVTYGPRLGEVERVALVGWDAFLERQLHPETIDDSVLDLRLAAFPSLHMSNAERIAAYQAQGQQGASAAGSVRTMLAELMAASLLRAALSERQLLEIMVDFWSNHLNIFLNKGLVRWLKTSDDRDVIRANALGTFRDLLLASAKSPAMLVYLDNAQNTAPGGRRRAGGINENYARELLELHTVGADAGYTHEDIVGVARTLTGWTVTRRTDPGSFVFDPQLHDQGEIRIPFLGLTFPAGGGMADGEVLLARLADHPRTAARMAQKLAMAFVADEPPPALVTRVAQSYLASRTDIRATLSTLLRSDEFRGAAGTKIKLPLRSLVSCLRALGATIDDPLPLLPVLNSLGQSFFSWPAPNGYPQLGAAWANTSGMLARWNAMFALAENRVQGTRVNLQSLFGATGRTPAELVSRAGEALLPQPIPGELTALLGEYVVDGRAPTRRLADRELNQALPGLAGLVLASPAFQMH